MTRTRRTPPLDERFRRELRALGLHGTGAHVLVALSGGADSVTLLHLLRFASGDAGPALTAAHLDHAMRDESAADARWVAGLCRAWGVPLLSERVDVSPRSEAEAREARYAFLRRAAAEAGATHVATAHHADDQAETVLFRVLRGTGARGLRGILPDDGNGLVRPLLPFWRAELRAHARAAGLRWREDAGNAASGPARNRLRLQVLPLLERTVAAGARRALVRLAALARAEEAAWDGLTGALQAAAATDEEGAILLARSQLAGYDSHVGARLLRGLLRRYGIVLDRAGTRAALQFITAAPSGRQMRLPGSLRIDAEFGHARISRQLEEAPAPDEPLAVTAAEGRGTARIGGRALTAEWSTGVSPPSEAHGGEGMLAVLAADGLRFPLELRGWAPGDRIRTAGGTRKVKKLLGERRVPRAARAGVPVLADAGGALLWVGGVALAAGRAPRPGGPALLLRITRTGDG